MKLSPIPCPFCGSKPKVLCQLPSRVYYWVYCPKCQFDYKAYTLRVEAIQAWNKRFIVVDKVLITV